MSHSACKPRIFKLLFFFAGFGPSWFFSPKDQIGQKGRVFKIFAFGDGDRELIGETEPCGGDRGGNGGNEAINGGGELDRLGDEVLDASLGDAGGDGEGRLWTTSL